MIGFAPAFSMPAEPKLAGPNGFTSASYMAKHATGLILGIATGTRNDANCRSSIFPKSVAEFSGSE